jgi:NAD(P)-dependent dehydrogenase (short-subunit alcohol dehydrogenase family)
VNLGLGGRRAIVTGGSRGIGLAVARGLAVEGASVALVARGIEALEEAASALSAVAVAADVAADAALATRAPRVIGVPADTGSDDAVAAMVTRVVDEFGGVDILVNAAANPNRGGGFPEETLADEINVKVQGYLRCARAVAPLMAATGWGRIVNVSGLAARQTGSVVGSVRNVAVAALTKNLADELGPSGVNVTVVHPGPTVTEVVPPADASRVSIGRLVTAQEVADVIVFLCSPRSVAVNGDAVAVGGGVVGSIHY